LLQSKMESVLQHHKVHSEQLKLSMVHQLDLMRMRLQEIEAKKPAIETILRSDSTSQFDTVGVKRALDQCRATRQLTMPTRKRARMETSPAEDAINNLVLSSVEINLAVSGGSKPGPQRSLRTPIAASPFPTIEEETPEVRGQVLTPHTDKSRREDPGMDVAAMLASAREESMPVAKLSEVVAEGRGEQVVPINEFIPPRPPLEKSDSLGSIDSEDLDRLSNKLGPQSLELQGYSTSMEITGEMQTEGATRWEGAL